MEAGDSICEVGVACRTKMFFVLDGEVTQDGKKVDHRDLFFG